MELASVTQDHSGATVHGLDDAANVNVGIAIFSKFANFGAVFTQGNDGEAALVIGCAGRADIEEARAIGEFGNFIHVSFDAHILIEQFRSVIDWDAGPRLSGKQRICEAD